ncbi:MAG TPA: hydroxyisourate hydrolase, partial [Myxococcales bacterium]|nr:hydroxyisourate hydrolase [Myxococcales bacterium]
MSPITTHILDTASGSPAANVDVQLEIRDRDEWRMVGRGSTDADGRCKGLMNEGTLRAGTYR